MSIKCDLVGTHVLLTLALVLWSTSVAFCKPKVADCDSVGGDTFPAPGHRICYYRRSRCNWVVIERSRGEIKFISGMTKIASPSSFKKGARYPNKRLCQYHVPACPPGSLSFLQWSSFDLENPIIIAGNKFCLDFVKILSGIDLGSGVMLDIQGALCGTQPPFSLLYHSGLPLKVEFKSNSHKRFKGFGIDILCAPFLNHSSQNSQSKRNVHSSLNEDVEEENLTVQEQSRMNCTEVAASPIPLDLEVDTHNPNSQELAIISTLLNATTPFFDDKEAPADLRVDSEALHLAFQFQNACNIFLRQAACSFLTMVEEKGLIKDQII